MAAQPIPPRPGRPAPDDMRSYLTPAVRRELVKWMGKCLGNPAFGDERAALVMLALDLPMVGGKQDSHYRELLAHVILGDEQFLDVIHTTLAVLTTDKLTYRHGPHEEVDRILALGRSAWSAGRDGLVHRSDVTAQTAFDHAAAAPDAISAELQEAWSKAYGRDGDPADAWDHAIRAVEYALIPIVVPNQAKANLGTVIGQLNSQPHLWMLGIRGRARDHGIEPLVAMLRLLWPDPNRHGSSNPERPATPEEGRAVVNLAITVVQWSRDGLIASR